MLWCFVFQHLAKPSVFVRVFSFEILLLCSGALFSTIWRFSFFGLLVAFAVALSCLWARRVRSGRLGPRIILIVFWGRPFGARNGHMDSAEMHKNKWVWGYLCAKGGSQNRCMRASLFRKQLFSRVFLRILAGPFGSKWARCCQFGRFTRCF